MDGREKIDPSYPLARRGTTEEVANVYAFIAPEASYVTGALWLVDGRLPLPKELSVLKTRFACQNQRENYALSTPKQD